MTLNPFHSTGLFQCPLKTSGNLWFCFSGSMQRKTTMPGNGLKIFLTNMSAEC